MLPAGTVDAKIPAVVMNPIGFGSRVPERVNRQARSGAERRLIPVRHAANCSLMCVRRRRRSAAPACRARARKSAAHIPFSRQFQPRIVVACAKPTRTYTAFDQISRIKSAWFCRAPENRPPCAQPGRARLPHRHPLRVRSTIHSPGNVPFPSPVPASRSCVRTAGASRSLPFRLFASSLPEPESLGRGVRPAVCGPGAVSPSWPAPRG